MSYEDYQRIWEEYTQKETIQTPLGLMVGRPTPEGSKMPWSGYSMLLENGPHKGEFIDITGLGGGHGTLYLYTKQYGKTEIRIEYDQPETEYEDEDELSHDVQQEDDDEDDAGQEELSHDVPKLKLSGEGFRTTVGKAKRAVGWFNGGRPKTACVPVSVMRKDKVCDTERIPTMSGKVLWRQLELRTMHFGDAWNQVGGLTSVWLEFSGEYDSGGASGPLITDVTSVRIEGDNLTIEGFAFGADADRSDWRWVTVTVGIVKEPEASGKAAPKWYIEEMVTPIEVDDWLTPASTVPMPCQSSGVYKQFSLEDFA